MGAISGCPKKTFFGEGDSAEERSSISSLFFFGGGREGKRGDLGGHIKVEGGQEKKGARGESVDGHGTWVEEGRRQQPPLFST